MDKILELLRNFLSLIHELIEKVIWSLDPYFVEASIADSFTVLVGFVAIGIPLSIQVISRATAKYKSDHLIKYLSRWKWVTPKRIYWASIYYFVIALVFRSFLPKHHQDCCSVAIQVYALGLIVAFLILVISVGLWYGHLFSQAGKSPKEIYDALKN